MNVFHEIQVPWPSNKPETVTRKSGPFQTNMSDAATRVEASVSAFTRNGKPWRTSELWIYSECALGARGKFIANQKGLIDPRVFVTFDLDGRQYNIATDRYLEPWQNLAGIAEYIKAIRAQERNGIFTAEEMMSSFAALPPTNDWFSGCTTIAAAQAIYRDLAKANHPDVGGDEATMARINNAFEQARERLK